MNINEEAVSGVMSTGGGLTQLNTNLCHINVPPMSLRLYQTTHDKVCNWWEKTAKHCMKEAGKEEKAHALAIGSTDQSGTAMITVTGDACWAKRSYGTNYNASSAVGAIAGIQTKKILYYGVKNKSCRICRSAKEKEIEPSKHKCFKKFSGPSTAMESAAITEGFKTSLKEHDLIYSQNVADGDSSTYSSVRNARPYKNVTVGKVECKNHLLRNYCKGLLSITSNTTHPLRARKILKDNYLRIRWGVDSCVKHWTRQNVPFTVKLENIKADIINGPHHIFGDHTKCAAYFCKDDMKKQENHVPELIAAGVFQKIADLAFRLLLHAFSFVYDETNNLVESFNARVAKFVGGKRVNFSQRRSYAGRCAAAVISFNEGVLQKVVHKFIFGTDANPRISRLETSRQELNEKRKEKNVKKKKFVQKSGKDKDAFYGEGCQKVDMDDQTYEAAKKEFLKKLDITSEEKDILERDTILQSASPLWLESRRKLLTASWFAVVCKRRPTTNCATLVKQILYGRDLSNVPSIKHGRENEHVALRELEKAIQILIT